MTFSVVEQPRWMIYGLHKFLKPTPHRFAIGSTEVTVEQFKEFRQNPKYDKILSPTRESPINAVTWYDAAAFCDFLSAMDGIETRQLGYEVNQDGKLDFAHRYWEREGYRLPTEREWEFACRAGTVTPWCFGNGDKELLSEYANWFGSSRDFRQRRFSPVASLKPNDFGLFDMHGNALEWCQELVGVPQGDYLDTDGQPDIACAYRGGFFLDMATNVSAGSRGETARTFGRGLYGVGFRVVKTMP